VTAAESGADVKPVALIDAQAGCSRVGLGPRGDRWQPQRDWAVDDGSGKINRESHDHFQSEGADCGAEGSMTFTIEQTYPTHPIGRFKLSVGQAAARCRREYSSRRA